MKTRKQYPHADLLNRATEYMIAQLNQSGNADIHAALLGNFVSGFEGVMKQPEFEPRYLSILQGAPDYENWTSHFGELVLVNTRFAILLRQG